MIRLRLTAALAAVVTCMLLPAAAMAAEGTKTAPAKPTGENTPIKAADTGSQAVQSSSTGGSLVRTFVGLAIVLAVIYGLYWVLKQVKASREEATRGDALAPVASIGLGPNRSLHLIRAGSDYILVGAGEHSVTQIRTYSLAEAVTAGLVPDPNDEPVDEATAVAPGAALPALLGAVTGAWRGPVKPKAKAAPAAAAVNRPAFSLQAALGSLREKTVRS